MASRLSLSMRTLKNLRKNVLYLLPVVLVQHLFIHRLNGSMSMVSTADAIVGAKTKDLLILEDEMKKVCNLYITTDDGSYVRKGMGTDVLRDLVQNQGKQYDVCVAIGPMIMMKFVCLLTKELEYSY